MKLERKKLVEPKQFMNPVLSRNGELGRAACEIMAAAINAVDPYEIIMENVRMTEESLLIGDQVLSFREIDRIFIIGFGKASVSMTKALLDILNDRVFSAKVVIKDKKFLEYAGYEQKLEVYLGGHPIPTEESIKSTRAILKDIHSLSSRDLVLVTISGGGSALFTDPVDGVSLQELRKMTDILLKSGADIQEINTLRKHLDRVKGGRLAKSMQPAQIQTLILSDVIGDRLDMIASGPTAPDPTTYREALDIVEKFNLWNGLPESIIEILQSGLGGEQEETLKSQEFQSMNIKNHLVGSNIKAAQAARSKAEDLGFNNFVLTSYLTGQTKHVAQCLAGIIKTELLYDLPLNKPACIILGGETTVEVTGEGKGGRNQDLVLHIVKEIADQSGALFISLGTDGEDGPTDAAGAVADGDMYQEGKLKARMNIQDYIKNNNAYHYFEELGGLIQTGSTGTNVNDLVFLMFGSCEDV